MKSWTWVLALLFVSSASAEEIVDQEFAGPYNLNYYLDYPGDYMAQTFTMRNSGQIVELGIDVVLTGYNHYQPPIDDLTVMLLRTDASGAPDINQVLATRDFNWQEFPKYGEPSDPYVLFDVSSWDVRAIAGEVLAIALQSDQVAFDSAGRWVSDHYDYLWLAGGSDPFPGGDFWLYSPKQFGPGPHKWADRYTDPNRPPLPRPGRDMGFRVVVNVPEPAGLVLAGCGLMGLASGRRWCAV